MKISIISLIGKHFTLSLFVIKIILRLPQGICSIFFWQWHVLKLSLILSHFMCLHRRRSVDNPFFSFSPNSVQLIQQQFELSITQLPFSGLYELFPKCISFLRNPKSTLGNECLIACAEMKTLTGLAWWNVKFCLDIFVDIVKETNSIIIQGESSKVLIFGCRLKHFQKSSWIALEIFVFSFSIIEVELFALKIAILFNYFSLSISQLRNSCIFLLNLIFEVSHTIFSSWIGDSE